MAIEFSANDLKRFFNGKDKFAHFHQEAEKFEEQMRVHSEGRFPDELINARRPNEPQIVLDYRKTIFVPKTKPFFGKIESTLQKIRRSSDWSIKYKEMSFDKIVEGEKLKDYVEEKYPVFTSVTNWAFSLLLRNYLVDPNAILLVAPIEIPDVENEFLKPVCTIFNSKDVIDFVEGEYAVLVNKIGATYLSEGKEKDGDSYYIITDTHILRYDQINGRRQFAVKFEHEHGLGEMPAFKLGAIVVDVYGNHSLYESRISGILPEFNEALREYSDLQAAKVLHLYPERWEYTQNECTSCKGNGTQRQIVNGEACNVTCDTCAGQGYIAAGPYSKILIKPTQAGETQAPTPAAGYVEKDVEIIKVQETSIEAHIFNGLSSINFEFLAKTPLNQSGTAKEVDKDELNTTVHAIAEDLIRIIDHVYYLIALYRYSYQYSKEEILEMLPDIAVPEKFDILSTKYFDEQITSAKANKLNPAILNAMEIAYATKAFNNDLDIAKHVQLILRLDPLAGVGEDDKMSRLSNGGITKLKYVVSSSINDFVNEATEKDGNFADLDVSKQRAIIYQMAQEQLNLETVELMPIDEIEEEEPAEIVEAPVDPNNLGKLPLALQQLALAKQRSIQDGDTKLADMIEVKMKTLISEI